MDSYDPVGVLPTFRVNIWGLRFYKKIILRVCELQLKKIQYLGSEDYRDSMRNSEFRNTDIHVERVNIFALRIENKVTKETKF